MKTLEIVNLTHDHDYETAQYALVDGDGILYTHICSNIFFSLGDLIADRPNRIDELIKKYGQFQVKHKSGIWEPTPTNKEDL